MAFFSIDFIGTLVLVDFVAAWVYFLVLSPPGQKILQRLHLVTGDDRPAGGDARVIGAARKVSGVAGRAADADTAVAESQDDDSDTDGPDDALPSPQPVARVPWLPQPQFGLHIPTPHSDSTNGATSSSATDG